MCGILKTIIKVLNADHLDKRGTEMMYKISFLPSNIVEVVGIDLDNGKPGFGKYRVLLVNPLIPSSWFIGFGIYCKTTLKPFGKIATVM